MASFRVGQRVRILWSNGWPELAGQTGVIVREAYDGGVLGDSEWDVAPDCWGTHLAPRTQPCGDGCADAAAANAPRMKSKSEHGLSL